MIRGLFQKFINYLKGLVKAAQLEQLGSQGRRCLGLLYLSLHDQLTGLYNRAYLENELQRLQNSREFPITIICMDLDGLKLVNDTLGHDQGGQTLKRLRPDIAGIVSGLRYCGNLPGPSLIQR